VRASFDDPNVVSQARLLPLMRLAQRCDLHGIVSERVRVSTHKGSHAAGKIATIVAGMLTGGRLALLRRRFGVHVNAGRAPDQMA
jgi:hypothetical protein